jgi:hypothetical protein
MSNKTTNTSIPMTAKEYYESGYWSGQNPLDVTYFFAESYATYRLQFEQEERQQSWIPTDEEWKQFPDAKWAAMDRDGWVFMHPDNPTCRTRFWIFGNGSCIPLKQVSPVNMDWTKCKVERPEEV